MSSISTAFPECGRLLFTYYRVCYSSWAPVGTSFQLLVGPYHYTIGKYSWVEWVSVFWCIWDCLGGYLLFIDLLWFVAFWWKSFAILFTDYPKLIYCRSFLFAYFGELLNIFFSYLYLIPLPFWFCWCNMRHKCTVFFLWLQIFEYVWWSRKIQFCIYYFGKIT